MTDPSSADIVSATFAVAMQCTVARTQVFARGFNLTLYHLLLLRFAVLRHNRSARCEHHRHRPHC
jgi:hypothetical protein